MARRLCHLLALLLLVIVASASVGSLDAYAGRPRLIRQTELVKKRGFWALLESVKNGIGSLMSCATNLKMKSRYERMIEEGSYADTIAMKASQMELNRDNFLPFLNDDDGFRGVAKNEFGYCAGMTDMTKKFMFLGFFDPKNVAGEVVPAVGTKKYREFFADKIEMIRRGEPTTIPGFKNLKDFGKDPDVAKLLKQAIAYSWADDAVNIQALQTYMRALKAQKAEAVAETVLSLEARANGGEMPRVLFTAGMAHPGRDRPIHSVMVRKVERMENKTVRLYVWETNYKGFVQERRPLYLEVRPDGTIFYQPWYEAELLESGDKSIAGKVLRLVELDNDQDAVYRYVKRIRKFCKTKPELCPKAVAKQESPAADEVFEGVD